MNNIKSLITLLCIVCTFSIKAQEKIAAKEEIIDDKIFTLVEQEASYPGGTAAWKTYLIKKLNASVPTNNDAPNGLFRVVIRFVIDKEGNTSNIVAETNIGYGMEAEAIRVIALSGKWLPAMQNGKLVKAYRRQPITFLVDDDGIEFKTDIPYVLYLNEENLASIKINNKIVDNIELVSTGAVIVNKGDGNFSITPNATGRIVISIMRKNKNVGNYSFETRKR
jgi:hypothetical protein